MYYLLGYRIIRMSEEKVCEELDKQDVNDGWGDNGKSKVFTALDSHVKKKVLDIAPAIESYSLLHKTTTCIG